jgi:hypothetical protein
VVPHLEVVIDLLEEDIMVVATFEPLGGEGGPLVAVDHMEEEGMLEEVVHLSKDLGWDFLGTHGI